MISHMNDCMSSQLLGIMHLHGCRVYLAGVSSSSGECRAGIRTRSLGMAGWPTSALLAHTHTHTLTAAWIHALYITYTFNSSHIHPSARVACLPSRNVTWSPEKTKNSFQCCRSSSSPPPPREVLTLALIQLYVSTSSQ